MAACLFVFVAAFFVYSLICHVMIIPLYNEMNYWARSRRGSTDTRSTSTFGSFLTMFGHKGVNKSRSIKVCKLLENFSVNFVPRRGCRWAWKPETKSFTFTSRMYAHYFDLMVRVDDRNITVKCILHVGAFSIASAENTPRVILKDMQMQEVVEVRPSNEPSAASLGRLFWLWTDKFRS